MFFCIIISLLLDSFVSARYISKDTKIKDDIFIIVNRIAAVGDGLDYYMKYDGVNKIESGMYSYFLSIFGIYMHNFGWIYYKNIGTQLTELVVGSAPFAQSANYTFLLQIMILDYWTFFFYTPLIAYLTMKLRYFTFRSIKLFPLNYFISASCFRLSGDLELAILVLISGFLFYFIIIFPILELKIK